MDARLHALHDLGLLLARDLGHAARGLARPGVEHGHALAELGVGVGALDRERELVAQPQAGHHVFLGEVDPHLGDIAKDGEIRAEGDGGAEDLLWRGLVIGVCFEVGGRGGYRALEVGEGIVADAEILIRVGAVGGDEGLDGLDEGLDVELDDHVDDRGHSLEEAHQVGDLLLEVDDELDALDEDALDLGLVVDEGLAGTIVVVGSGEGGTNKTHVGGREAAQLGLDLAEFVLLLQEHAGGLGIILLGGGEHLLSGREAVLGRLEDGLSLSRLGVNLGRLNRGVLGHEGDLLRVLVLDAIYLAAILRKGRGERTPLAGVPGIVLAVASNVLASRYLAANSDCHFLTWSKSFSG